MKIQFIIEEKTESIPVTIVRAVKQKEDYPVLALHWKNEVHTSQQLSSHRRF
jgi:hypothetical protein